MHYLAPFTLLAALISTALFFSPAASHAATPTLQAPAADLLGDHSPLRDGLMTDFSEIDDQRPTLRVMSEAGVKAFEFITLPHMFFGHDSIKLVAETQQILDGLAQYVLDNDTTISRILIHAHANEIADENYNFRLSDRRAYAIWDYLAAKGVEPELMTVTSRGELTPIDENWTRAGRQRNRYVEIQIVRATN